MTDKKNKNKNISKQPTYFSAGNRKIYTMHIKLRHNCILNNDLFRRNIIGPPLCSCGQVVKSYFFLFMSIIYQAEHRRFSSLVKIDQINIIDTRFLNEVL